MTMAKKMLALALVLMMLCGGALAEGVTVGVIQYATHPSLDNCYEGFVQGLAEGGYVEGDNLTIDFQNAMGDMANSDMQAKTMVSNGEDMLVGIATPSAMSAYAATKDEGKPVVFVAVSDAVAAGIVKSNEEPGTNCTGVSDVLNLEEQVKMIRAFQPEAKKIGIIYTTSEPNSVSHLEKIKPIAEKYGFEIVAEGISSAAEVATAASSLIAKDVDCINNFTDNNVVDNLPMVLHATNEAGIPVFGSEVEQVKNGCVASMGLEYFELGKQTGAMAAKILKGEAKASEMEYETITDYSIYINSKALEALSIEIPQDVKDGAVETSEE